MYLKGVAATAAAVAVSATVAVGVAPQSAQAATSSISVAGVVKTNAADIKSKGSIKTPTVRTSGNVAVSSRSYTITKGKKVVAKTSTQGKSYKVSRGTYKVKTTTKYRTYTTKKVANGTTTGYKDAWEALDGSTSWSSWSIDEGAPGSPSQGGPASGGANPHDSSHIDDTDCQPGQRYSQVCTDSAGRVWEGDISTDGESYWEFYAYEQVVRVPAYRIAKTYSGYKSITKTQTVTVGNSGYMTLYEYKKIKNKSKLSKVRSIVGGTGHVVDRYSVGGDDYVVRDFNDHYIYFCNGKVWAKQW